MPTITYTTPGTFHQFTVPAGVTSVTIEAIGKGGLGGLASNPNYDGGYPFFVAGGGGGGGGYGRVTQAVTAGQIVSIYLPTLANDPLINYVQVAYGNDGSGYTLVMRVNPGGNGGIGFYYDQFEFQTAGPGGAGGNAVLGYTGGTNFVSYDGGNGITGQPSSPYYGGGGGGGAGTTGNGNSGSGSVAGAGASLYGGNGGNGGTYLGAYYGSNGSNYGGGGGGALTNQENSPQYGGSNGGAWAAITYTEPPPINDNFFYFF